MADYTVVNLMEVDDLGPRYGYAPDLEARFAREPLGLQKSGLSYQRLAPDFRMPWGHRHGEQEEIYVILSGSARMALDDVVVEVGRFDTIRVGPDTMRSIHAGPDGVELIAYGAPRTPETEHADAQPVPGWWPE